MEGVNYPIEAIHYQNSHESNACWLVDWQHEQVDAAKGFPKYPARTEHRVNAKGKGNEQQDISQHHAKEVNTDWLPGSLKAKKP